MAIIKCKMCGGDLEIREGQSVGICEYCGRKQTLPRLDSDRKVNLYDRASHFRRNNDYDKAMGIYENILNEDTTDAEAYWSLVLCRYGIEYVEDPATHKRVPTVNRAQYTSIYADQDYKSAISNADSAQKAVYEEEAAAIDQIQKGILEISQKEEPFDVFICYKETDQNGRRTPDSVLANDLYHQLTQEGFKVFFSRITLEDKLGQEYEPYIFAALNSAKVMVVLGTRPEYFSAVWVKNEWSRFLALIGQGKKKMLIPAYKDMDPYDLPEEFSHLQAQDMSKLGFMQDLIRGIKKIAVANDAEESEANQPAEKMVPGLESLLRRGNMYLEDGDFKGAEEYFDRVLDIDPECGYAYLGKVQSEFKCRDMDDFSDWVLAVEENNNYKRAMRFGSAKLKKELEKAEEQAHKKIERYNEEIAEWKSAFNEMFQKRMDALEKEIARRISEPLKNIEIELNAKIFHKNEDIEKESRKIEIAKKSLPNLKFYQIGEKKRLEGEIENSERIIALAQALAKSIKNDLKNEEDKIKNSVFSQTKGIFMELEDSYRLPMRPAQPDCITNQERIDPESLAYSHSRSREEIIMIMNAEGIYEPKELKEDLKAIFDIQSNQTASRYIHNAVAMNCIEIITINGFEFYKLKAE